MKEIREKIKEIIKEIEWGATQANGFSPETGHCYWKDHPVYGTITWCDKATDDPDEWENDTFGMQKQDREEKKFMGMLDTLEIPEIEHLLINMKDAFSEDEYLSSQIMRAINICREEK